MSDLATYARVLAHLHVQPCPCPRCRVSRTYARLLAAQALRDEANASQSVAAEGGGMVTKPHRSDLDSVAHGEMIPR